MRAMEEAPDADGRSCPWGDPHRPYLAASEPADAASRYRRRLALAFFLQAFGGGSEIRLPGLSWEKERLEELAGRARAWLEEPVAAFEKV